MLRWLLAVLVLCNFVAFALASGLFAPVPAAGAREPERLDRQVHPERLKTQALAAPADGVAPTAPAAPATAASTPEAATAPAAGLASNAAAASAGPAGPAAAPGGSAASGTQ